VVPIRDRELKRYLKDEVLAAYLRDNVKARALGSDGRYRHIEARGAERFDVQKYFIEATARNRTGGVARP
jgi:polyphosphate kinase